MSIPRPVQHLIAAGRMYPDAWRQVDVFREGRGRDVPDWPRWCFLPMGGWYAMVSADQCDGGPITDLRLVADVGRLAAIGAWRYSQGIYRFDADLYASLRDTTFSGEIPSEVLYRLPEYSIYIETPGMDCLGYHLHGFWTHLECDANDGRTELRLLLDTESDLIPIPLHLGDWSLAVAVTKAIEQIYKGPGLPGIKFPRLRDADVDRQVAAALTPLVSLVLYICSDNVDIAGPGGSKPARPEPKRIKHGWRMFPVDKPIIWIVGKSIGDQLREAICVAGGAVAPHIRRAHWHGYWVGPAEQKRFRYQWLSPILVGGGDR